MNTTLWTVQVLWGVFFSINGFGKIVWCNAALWEQARQQVPWFSAVPRELLIFIGVCEFLAGIGLILPAMTRVKPKLTPLAASGLTLIMILAALFHIPRGEYAFVALNVVLGVGAAFIAYGRRSVRPLTPSSPSAFRLLSGFAVLGALLLVDYAPVRHWLSLMRR